MASGSPAPAGGGSNPKIFKIDFQVKNAGFLCIFIAKTTHGKKPRLGGFN